MEQLDNNAREVSMGYVLHPEEKDKFNSCISHISVFDKYEVKEITHKETYPFLKKIHYAKRICPISHSFGLFDLNTNTLIGVVTFGCPAIPQEYLRFKDFYFLELNRLCLIKQLEKNALSFFVSKSLNKLPQNSVVISYADIAQNHTGYIYQATNWIYTGIGSQGVKSYKLKDGRIMHQKNFNEKKYKHILEEVIKSSGKHRYFYFIGNKTQKRKFMKILLDRYKMLPYPKTENINYEIKNKISLTKNLNGFM